MATKKTAGSAKKKSAAKKIPAKKTSAAKRSTGKKATLVRENRSTGSGPACWPGFERVASKKAGTKGSCKPKAHQTADEKKEDARQAAGSKLRKAGGNKARANRMR